MRRLTYSAAVPVVICEGGVITTPFVMLWSSEAPRVAQPEFLGGKQQCVRGADCTPQTRCNLQPVSLVREGMVISYRVPKVKPLKVLGRGKGEVMEFKHACFLSIPQHCFLLAASGTTQPRGTGSVAGQFINDCLGTHINISQM